jgi:hypothetical protein
VTAGQTGYQKAEAHEEQQGVTKRPSPGESGSKVADRAKERTLPRRVPPPGSGHSLTCLALPGPGPPGEARPGYRTRSAVAADLVRSTLRLMSNGRRYSRRGDDRAHSATVRTMHRPTMPMVAPPGRQHARRINFWPASACIKSPRPRSFFHLTFDESEKVGIDPFRIDDCNTVSATLVDFQDRVRNDRWYAAASRTDRHDLIVFAVYDE